MRCPMCLCKLEYPDQDHDCKVPNERSEFDDSDNGDGYSPEKVAETAEMLRDSERENIDNEMGDRQYHTWKENK